MKKISSFIDRTSLVPLPFLYSKSGIVDAGDSFYDATGEYYSALFAERKTDDISFYKSLAEKNGGPVLEAACGDGRILFPIAEAGLNITGNDVSKTMLELCRKRLDSLPVTSRSNVRFSRADIRQLPFKKCFQLILLPYNSFNHLLTEQEQENCLQGFFGALKSGGRLVMEVLPYHEHYETGLMLRKKSFIPSKKAKIAMYSRLEHDKVNSRHTVHWFTVFKEKGKKPKRIITKFKRKDIPLNIVKKGIRDAGFIIENIFYDYNKNTEKGDKRLIIASKE
ncbi:class I SAM-dependent methyltransferase [candidate division KSB1 bacterium]